MLWVLWALPRGSRNSGEGTETLLGQVLRPGRLRRAQAFLSLSDCVATGEDTFFGDKEDTAFLSLMWNFRFRYKQADYEITAAFISCR